MISLSFQKNQIKISNNKIILLLKIKVIKILYKNIYRHNSGQTDLGC